MTGYSVALTEDRASLVILRGTTRTGRRRCVQAWIVNDFRAGLFRTRADALARRNPRRDTRQMEGLAKVRP